ncbi:hypothetical protein VOLCADRAFT_98596 [Volvox carteri f. nagariensis]|uniref:Glycosyl transferase CAP10 domain-containing protein n=1 Tax=Volvox carteri f. nagariensis TaxID=3068 RepID=D8UFS1_VOLCA|nr:uncharacterized protein VOLCADRAFT_98596 [Volvox carteri f. nagariensis]EFJ41384.1 hypothetical protein VOLCADRAFT_98596 [Volvox carteri f. nagariensis]|eukprot:XP_002957490.1 hypothetical protein VOLCADRAFT_98596 [Volvox carteri f. nagariensis]
MAGMLGSSTGHVPSFIVALLLAGLPQHLAYDCSAHPWIDDTVKLWFRASYAAARESSLSIEESLQAISDIKWAAYTGKSMAILTYDEAAGAYRVTFKELHRHNEPHKPLGMQRIIERAVMQHNADLVRALGKRELKFIFGTEDWPIVDSWKKLRLPSFQMCHSPDTADVPVPDFTWEQYSQAQYTNNSWWEVRRLLLLKSAMLPWRLRERDLFMRGDAGVGYRKVLMPLMHEVQVNRSDIALFGIKVNFRSTGFYVSDLKHFSWLDNWCQHRYLVHTSGLTYSASLKYKLACGAVVVNFKGDFQEFYYPALQHGVHLLSFPEADRGVLLNDVAPKIKTALADLEANHQDTPPPIAMAARDFALTQLTDGALSCYWYKALLAYAGLYYTATPADVPTEVLLDGGPRNGGDGFRE